MVSWFSFAYAIGMLGMGRLLDRIGTRRGFAIAIVAWSAAAMGHAMARSAAAFSLARGFLGLGESGNFPAAIKTVSEWFPNSERALAVGIFNAGSNVGAVLAPILVPWIALTWGWEWAFIATGAIGFIWLMFWLAIYREPARHPKVSPGELELIRSDRSGRGAANSLDAASALSPDLGISHWQVAHRSGVALLSVLAAEVPRRRLGREAGRSRGAARRDLRIRGYWIRRRRLVLEHANQARVEREQGSEDGDARRRAY